MLSRLVITFLPRSKLLLISWLQSPSAVILEPPKINLLAARELEPGPAEFNHMLLVLQLGADGHYDLVQSYYYIYLKF